MKKILSILAVSFLLASLVLPVVLADTLVNSSTSTASNMGRIMAVHPSATTAPSAIVFKVEPLVNYNVTAVTLKLYRVGVPSATLRGVLMNSTYGILENSTDTLEAGSLTTSSSGLDYNFTFAATTTFSLGTTYYVGFYCESAVLLDATTNLVVTRGTGMTSASASYYKNSAWANAWTITNSLYGDLISATPTPTPTTAGSGDADIEYLTAIILPWLVPLLICLIPALLAYKYVGELGFFIGLNIGAILAYVTLAGTAYAFPLWGIILVGVMDVAVVLMRR